MTRTDNVVKNLMFNTLSQFVTILLAFISRNIFIKNLGMVILGVNSLFTDVLQTLSLADLGIGAAIIFSYYEPLARKDYHKVAALANYYKKVYRIIAGVVLAVGLVIMLFLDRIVNTTEPVPGLYFYYLLALGNTVASYLMVYKSTVIEADQKKYVYTKYQVIIDIVKTLSQMAAVIAFHSYTAFLVIALLTTLIKNTLMSKKVDELYPFIKSKSVETVTEAEKKGLFSNFSSVFIYKLASVAFGSTDSTLISMICGTIVVGLYANYKLISFYLGLVITMVFSACSASVGNLLVEGSPERRYDIFNTLQTLCYVFSIVAVSCFYNLVNEFIICWIKSEDVLLDMVTVAVVAINVYMTIVLQPIMTFREAAGLYRKTKYFMLAATVINIGLSIILGLKWGIAGIFAATIIARLSTYFWYEPRLLFSTFFSKSEKSFYLGLLVNFLVTCGVAALQFAIISRIHLSGWIGWIVKAVISVAVAGVVCLLVYRKTRGFKWLVYKVKSVAGMAED